MMSDQRHDAVSRRAYELWEQEGGEHGRHEEHWHRAAGELGEDSQKGSEEPVNVAAPDGTTMPVAAPRETAGSQHEPADTPTDAPAGGLDPVEPAGEPVDSPAAATPLASAAKSAKPRKPKAK